MLPPGEQELELVERKGLGHPDTLCDALAEEFSRGLSRYYLRRFGSILHHNVDKALLRGGLSRAALGGGELIEPIDVYLAGRAVTEVQGVKVPVHEIAVDGSRRWLEQNLPGIDPMRHFRIHCLVREGSADLANIYARARSRQGVLSNDTSFGVGYAPLSSLERTVLHAERELNSARFREKHPEGGADVKVMGVREGANASLTVARAFIARHLFTGDDYAAARAHVQRAVRSVAAEHGIDAHVGVNVGDDPASGSYYLTLIGTSAEAGDDGEVGRGNRANGLITPRRPMSLEALAGKNPVSHVGKLYNVVAREIAEQVVADNPEIERAVCYLVSEIGRPIHEPKVVRVDVGYHDGAGLAVGGKRGTAADRVAINRIVEQHLSRFDELTERLVRGTVQLF